MADQKQERLLSLKSILTTAILGLIGFLLNRLPEDFFLHTSVILPYKWLMILTILIILICLYSFVNYFILRNKYSKDLPSKTHTEQINPDEAHSNTNPQANLFTKLPPINDKSLFADTPTIYEIRNKIENQPAYLQDDTAKAFIGFKIHWILNLQYVLPPENYHVINVGFFHNIRGAVDTNEFPHIKLAKTNHSFDVWAEIVDIHYPVVELGIILLNHMVKFQYHKLKKTCATKLLTKELQLRLTRQKIAIRSRLVARERIDEHE